MNLGTMSTAQTITQIAESLNDSLSLRSPPNQANNAPSSDPQSGYRYAHLLPAFPKDEHYPPLTPFDHIDPAARALSHPNQTAFLDKAQSVIEITPNLGTEVHGVNLAQLDSDGRDQLALLVSKTLSLQSANSIYHIDPYYPI